MVRIVTSTLLVAVILAATAAAAPAEEKMRRVAPTELVDRDGQLVTRQSYCGAPGSDGTCCCSICDCDDICICDLICGEIVGCDG